MTKITPMPGLSSLSFAKRPRDGDALLLAARQLAGIVPALVGDADLGQHRLGLLGCFGFRAAQHVDLRGGDVFQDRHVLPQVELLEHHGELRADAVDLLRVRRMRRAVAHAHLDQLALDADLARGGRLQKVDAAQEGRLARTR
nr:hypothetical protein [Mangrovicoccus ximenensis]